MRGAALLTLCGACILPAAAPAQDTTGTTVPDTTRTVPLAPVTISITRDPRAATLTVPYAVSVTERSPLERRALMLDLLAGVPGVFVVNRNNPTQDPRIVIRGFGARTAFGVRGIRVLHDGIPLTLADGQTALDYLDTESVERVEVIRGSASSLYGNAAGGVVAFSSHSLDSTVSEAAYLAGPHSLGRASIRLSGGDGTLDYALGLSRSSENGFRDHARQRVTRASGRLRHNFGASSITAQLLAYDMPLAENPGALTAAQLEADPRMAEPLAVKRAAGKSASQVQAGLVYDAGFAGGDLSAVVFGGRRRLENPLTFAVIDLDRTSGGLSLRLSRERAGPRPAGVTLGVDVQHQDDDRVEHENCHDATQLTDRCPIPESDRGRLRRAQRELVSSIGPYASGEVALGRYRLSAGIRADAVIFDVRDRKIGPDDPDESGRRSMRAISPRIGLVTAITAATAAYANVSSAFETPTATELGNKPDGSAGVNNTLDPQRSRTIEAGLKGVRGGVAYDLVAFTTNVSAELVPFEVAGGAGRRFFRNAGRTRRRGAEVGLHRAIGKLELRSAATYSDFRFVDFRTATDDFSGKAIPGVPPRFAELSAEWSELPVRVGLSGRFVSSTFVDDANTARAAGYGILNLRAGGDFSLGRVLLRPAVALDNVLDRDYVGAVSVNAAGGRFFEPAPGRTLIGSLAVRF